MIVIATSWWERERLNNRNHTKPVHAFCHVIANCLLILFKPIFYFADFWSDVALLIEMARIFDCSYYHFYASLGFLIFYQLCSSISIYFDHESLLDAILQYFNVYVFKEIHVSAKAGRPVFFIASAPSLRSHAKQPPS